SNPGIYNYANGTSLESGTIEAYFPQSGSSVGADSEQASKKQKIYGTQEYLGGSPHDQEKSEFEHDGIAARDLDRNGKIDYDDRHDIKTAFINHYIVETREVELNSSSSSHNTIHVHNPEMLRSTGVDGSADHVAADKYGHVDDI